MNDQPSTAGQYSAGAVVSVLAFGALSLVGGWLIVCGHGFHHAIGRYSTHAVFVSGLPAVLMAILQFLAAALAFSWLLHRRLSLFSSALGGFALVLVPPLIYILR